MVPDRLKVDVKFYQKPPGRLLITNGKDVNIQTTSVPTGQCYRTQLNLTQTKPKSDGWIGKAKEPKVPKFCTKHPKDIARRQRKLAGHRTRDSVPNKRKHTRKFDSTLGYPGEGPDPSSRNIKGTPKDHRRRSSGRKGSKTVTKEGEFTCNIADCDHERCTIYGHFHRTPQKQGAERRLAEGKPKPRVTRRWNLCKLTEFAADCQNRDPHGHCGCLPNIHYADLIDRSILDAELSAVSSSSDSDEWRQNYDAFMTEEEPSTPPSSPAERGSLRILAEQHQASRKCIKASQRGNRDEHKNEVNPTAKVQIPDYLKEDKNENITFGSSHSDGATNVRQAYDQISLPEQKESDETALMCISRSILPDVANEKPPITRLRYASLTRASTGLSASAAPAYSRDSAPAENEESSPVVVTLSPPGREVMIREEETDPLSIFAEQRFSIYLNSGIVEKRGFIKWLNTCRINLATHCCCCSVGEQFHVNQVSETTIGEAFHFKGASTKEIRNWFLKFDRNGSKLQDKKGDLVLLQDMYNTTKEVPIYINLLNEALVDPKLMRMAALQADFTISQTLNSGVTDWVGRRLQDEPMHLKKPMLITWTVIAIVNQCVVRGLLHKMATTGTNVPDFTNRVRSSVQRSKRTRT